MSEIIKQLLTKSQAELDALFSAKEAGPIPNGQADGTAIVAPGTNFSDEIAKLVNIFAWQGKVFDAASGTLRNRILPFGSTRSSPRSTRRRAGSTRRNASCSITPRPRWWRSGSATRSA